MQTDQTDSTKDGNKSITQIIYIIYEKHNLDEVSANSYQINIDKHKLILGLLIYFGDLFNVTLGKWDTEPMHLKKKIQVIIQ